MSDAGYWFGFAGIIVGGLIAISGQLGSARIARKTADAAIESDRNQRLWERRAAAYVDTVQELLARRTRREALTSRGDIGNIGSHPREELQDVPESPESIRLRSVLRAYASPQVWAAFGRADEANTAFWVSLSRLQSTHLTAANDDQPNGQAYQAALQAMQEAQEHAHLVDDLLFDAINAELSWLPPADLPPGKHWCGLLAG